MSNFDIAEFALKSVCPNNEIKYDDTGMPSIMVYVPKATWKDLGIGDSTETFPAFIINGKEIDGFYFSKYNNSVHNNRAYSIPGQDPTALINFDQACQRCEAKGEGWHEITNLEWIALALWSLKNDTLPYGNNNYGKDHNETIYKAIPSSPRDDQGRICRVGTGTGPLTWSHNHAADGVFDMNGNVWEWCGGIRMVKGEIQVTSHDGKTFGNDAADTDNSQSPTSSLWYAINGKTGELIKPDGSGTTANSLKLDMESSNWKWVTDTVKDPSNSNRSAEFSKTTCAEDVVDAAKRKLMALGLLPLENVDTTKYAGDRFYCNNGADERLFHRGGHWSSGADAGVFSLSGLVARSDSYASVGLRSAFVKLPAD